MRVVHEGQQRGLPLYESGALNNLGHAEIVERTGLIEREPPLLPLMHHAHDASEVAAAQQDRGPSPIGPGLVFRGPGAGQPLVAGQGLVRVAVGCQVGGVSIRLGGAIDRL